MDKGHLLDLKREQLELKEKQLKLRAGLPFLYGWKWYKWAREFFDSTNKQNFLCAANQISKSSTQIRKCIDWATNKPKWKALWGRDPIQFWYLYPSRDVATAEFITKWQQFLPKNEYKDDATYGWKAEFKKGEIHALHFNSGVHIFFKTYAQDSINLQTGTCDALFCDEELPFDLYDELSFRLSAADGYFHMVFTATLGQEEWRLVIEERGRAKEKFPQACKLQVSMFDCMKYEDGTPSHWSIEKIQGVIAKCSTKNEILRRVYGRFVVEKGLKYEQFDRSRHMVPAFPIPADWYVYGAADLGSGGAEAHPAAIVFVAVRPDFRFGAVFKGWRGDNEVTVATDVLDKFLAMKGTLELSGQSYDWSSADFKVMTERAGEPFMKANKDHEFGEKTINSIFKHNMMVIFEGDEELEKLATELATLKKETSKRKAKDDIADAFRYAVVIPPWDWSFITGAEPEWKAQAAEKNLTPEERQKKALADEIIERRKEMANEQAHARAAHDIQAEIDEWNGYHDVE